MTTIDWLDRSKMTRHWIWGLPLAVAIVVLDQLSKAWILGVDQLNGLNCLHGAEPCGKIELSPIFDISMIWNRGVSFGLAQSEGWARWGLVVVIVVIICGFAIWLLRAERWLTALSLAMVIGGAVGNNVIDRVRFGAVVDFLDFQGLYFPWVFNVADSAISVGAVLLLLDQLLAGRKRTG